MWKLRSCDSTEACPAWHTYSLGTVNMRRQSFRSPVHMLCGAVRKEGRRERDYSVPAWERMPIINWMLQFVLAGPPAPPGNVGNPNVVPKLSLSHADVADHLEATKSLILQMMRPL